MPNDPSTLLCVVVLAAVIAFVGGIYFWIGDRSGAGSQQAKRRLHQTIDRDEREAIDPLRRKTTKDGASPWLASILTSAPLLALENLVVTSGIRTPTDRVILYMVLGFAGVVETVDLVLGWDLYACAITGGGVAVLMPLLLLRRIRRRRFGLIAAQLPDALDMLVRSLRAGHPVATGIQMIAQEMPVPIGTEFALVWDEMAFGLDLRGAFEKMGKRLNIVEINYMIIAIRIQVGTGGNLAEVLGSLSNLMRERQKLRGKVKAMSAEARLSGHVLCALPIGVTAMLMLINPHYYDGMKTNPILEIILIGAGALTLMGILLLRRFVNIRI